ncbi:MAG TPA: choice-of-anchor tandem repeat GloVer-containing protein, partial [Verrucomicrobiae bacterium]|nr:choice-of-anchor tandem repeat GloVer-containing protein [Verrucomicrobiae bacterium]
MKLTRLALFSFAITTLLFNEVSVRKAVAGSPEVVYEFEPGPANPSGPPVLGPDGCFYGVTQDGGYGAGTIYRVTTNGAWETVWNFNRLNGRAPVGPLCVGADGWLYGVT